MLHRPATPADFPAIAALTSRWELAMFGTAEQSEEEIVEGIERIDDIEHNSRLLFDDDRLIGAGLRWRTATGLVADPQIDPGPVYADLFPWFAAGRPAEVEALGTDSGLRAALAAAGWQHSMSSFELIREVTPDLVLARPSWPDGITVHDLRAEDAERVHRLIYVDAGWAEIPGHPHRDFEEWRSIFLSDHARPEQQVLAWRGDRLVGVALGRTWDDGTGWIAQLATARDERGQGIGRALLLEALHRRRAAGARSLGLSVQAANRNAIDLYLDAGLQIDREWLTYTPGPTT
jgi:ribosomal protein S18 acetylase RimI-like enzyme